MGNHLVVVEPALLTRRDQHLAAGKIIGVQGKAAFLIGEHEIFLPDDAHPRLGHRAELAHHPAANRLAEDISG